MAFLSPLLFAGISPWRRPSRTTRGCCRPRRDAGWLCSSARYQAGRWVTYKLLPEQLAFPVGEPSPHGELPPSHWQKQTAVMCLAKRDAKCSPWKHISPSDSPVSSANPGWRKLGASVYSVGRSPETPLSVPTSQTPVLVPELSGVSKREQKSEEPKRGGLEEPRGLLEGYPGFQKEEGTGDGIAGRCSPETQGHSLDFV